jgi:hypothetical protein
VLIIKRASLDAAGTARYATGLPMLHQVQLIINPEHDKPKTYTLEAHHMILMAAYETPKIGMPNLQLYSCFQGSHIQFQQHIVIICTICY